MIGEKMEILDAMKNRRSVHRYERKIVPLKKITKILEAGRYAPSGANQQPWRYIVVDSEELKERIRREAEKCRRGNIVLLRSSLSVIPQKFKR